MIGTSVPMSKDCVPWRYFWSSCTTLAFPASPVAIVGVDVFFVISGFVITGLLLRERASTDRTSLLGFYARRCRRILPAATLVILSTVVLAYFFLGVVTGANTAGDGRWAAVFLANFHFESIGTNYLLSLRPPSPLQNFWSLSVEEQFYIVYPSLFLVLARMRGRLSLRARLTIALLPVIVLSYALSIFADLPQSRCRLLLPLTRAWELALGALIAVGVPALKRLPGRWCAAMTWAGLVAILAAACMFNATTPYPGSLVAIPVVGAGLVIAGGVGAPRWGAEALLKLGPAQWLGRLSYSLYLWHWPILVIGAQYEGKTTLPLAESLLLVMVSVGLSMVTYRLIENPIRHSHLASRQSVALGAMLVVSTVVILTFVLSFRPSGASVSPVTPAPNERAVHQAVSAASRIREVPVDLLPPLGTPAVEWDDGIERSACIATLAQSKEAICTLGDARQQPPHGRLRRLARGDVAPRVPMDRHYGPLEVGGAVQALLPRCSTDDRRSARPRWPGPARSNLRRLACVGDDVDQRPSTPAPRGHPGEHLQGAGAGRFVVLGVYLRLENRAPGPVRVSHR